MGSSTGVRAVVAVAVACPALVLGGVSPWLVGAFALLMGLAWGLAAVDGRVSALDRWALLPAAAGLVGLAQALPGTVGLAPELSRLYGEVLEGTGIRHTTLSAIPGQSALDGVRLLALAALFGLAHRVGWRTAASVVAILGLTELAVGLGHLLVGADAILGTYTPRDAELRPGHGLLTTFVNPNHQSALFLLAAACAGALATEERKKSRRDDADRSHAQRAYAWTVAAVALGLGVFLSGSFAGWAVGLLLAPALVAAGLGGLGRALRDRRRDKLTAAGLTALGSVAAAGAAALVFGPAALGGHSGKLPSVRAALDLVPLAPWTGTGLGSFVDLGGMVTDRPDLPIRLYTHIESWPVAAVVELGVVLGAAVVLATGAWWLLAWRAHPPRPQRLMLLGVAAVLVHGCADFHLAFLGVSAPLVLVAGAATGAPVPHAPPPMGRRRALLVAVASIGLGLVGLWLAPRGWIALRNQHVQVLAAERTAHEAFARRPLDARLHLGLARAAAEAGEWSETQRRATAVSRLSPRSADGWLVLAASRKAQGTPSLDALGQALARLQVQPNPELARYLLRSYPPQVLARLAPNERNGRHRLLWGLALTDPAGGEAVARAATRLDGQDPVPLRVRARLALQRRDGALAVHHARLLVQLEPERARNTHLLVKAFLMDGGRDAHTQARAALEWALAREDVDDRPSLQVDLAEVHLGDPAGDLAEAKRLIDALASTRSLPEERRRLARRLAERQRGP